jgi:hypothetical protein
MRPVVGSLAMTAVRDEREVLLHPFAMAEIVRVGSDEPFQIVLRDLQRARVMVKYEVEGDTQVGRSVAIDVTATVEAVVAKIGRKIGREVESLWRSGMLIETGLFRPYCEGDPTFVVKAKPPVQTGLSVKYEIEEGATLNRTQVPSDATVADVMATIASECGREVESIWLGGARLRPGPFRPHCKGDPTFLVKPKQEVPVIDLGRLVLKVGERVSRKFEFAIDHGNAELDPGLLS